MSKMNSLSFSRKIDRWISLASSFGLLNWVSDKTFLSIRYRLCLGKKLDFDHPKTYNEKLQWLKLHDHNEEYHLLVDKYEVKKKVAERIGSDHIIPTLGVWDSFDAIDFSSLPGRFVLKCTHDSGGVVICKDKSIFDLDKARKKMNKCLKRNYFGINREWPYKDIRPRIIAEQYMEDESGFELKDYKFFCFDGTPKLLFIACDRCKQNEETKFNFYDMDFRFLPFTNGHPNAPSGKITKPKGFDEMRQLAAILSKGLPHARIDFYDINGKVFFGEITFFHWSGLMPFNPPEWDEKIGKLIKLPTDFA